MKVKICGITNLEDALFCSSAGADALGFIFVKDSPRYVNQASAKKIIKELDPFISKVGVFVNEDRDKVYKLAVDLNLDVLQFHGEETSQYCQFFSKSFRVIKTVFPHHRPWEKYIREYKVDAFLFDLTVKEKLQGIKSLSVQMLKEISFYGKRGERIIISGGLNQDNLSSVIKFNPYALDVASGVEKTSGKKCSKLVKDFIGIVKEKK